MNSAGRITLCLVAIPSAVLAAGFDEIDFWVGEGANRAALVIDWDEQPGAGAPLVWGYRWDGEATGVDLLVDVVSADPRLFVRMSSPGQFGVGVFGLGYDANADATFGLTDLTLFDAAGIATTGPSDLAVSTDAADFYEEGWAFAGFWHYGVAPGDPLATGGAWSSSPVGPSFRSLEDGVWDAWTFTPAYSSAAFPDAPEPAPPVGLPGDYNQDGRVDAADYTVWRDTRGSVPTVAGAGADGDFSWEIDAGDYEPWRGNYGAPPTASSTVPEPSAVLVTALLLFGVGWRIPRSG